MHIGFLSFESPYGVFGGGIASYLRAVIPALLDSGHRVTLITGGDSDETADPRVRICKIQLPNVHWYISKLPLADRFITLPLREAEWSIEFQRKLAKVIREEPLDLVETTELGSWSVARNAEVPVLVRLHGSDHTFRRYTGAPVTISSAWNRRLQREALNRAQGVTAPSQFQAEEVTRELGWRPGRIEVVPNALTSFMLAKAASNPVGRPAEPITILYTGRLSEVKGIETLLRAAAKVLAEFPNVGFVLAGSYQLPASSGDWAEQLRHHGLDGRVQWLGSLNPEALARLYRNAHIFVMPSHYETFCISCVEAMAFGIPVVASRAGALPELVRHEQSGLLVRPGDVEELAASIKRLVRDQSMRQILGASGRDFAHRNFTPEAVARQTSGVYQRIGSNAA